MEDSFDVYLVEYFIFPCKNRVRASLWLKLDLQHLTRQNIASYATTKYHEPRTYIAKQSHCIDGKDSINCKIKAKSRKFPEILTI